MMLEEPTLREGAALTLITSDVAGFQIFSARINSAIGALASIIGGVVYLALHLQQTAGIVLIPVLSKFCSEI